MTRADLYDWVVSCGCEIITLPEYKAKVIYVKNPKNGRTHFINLPIDDRPVRDYTVFRICAKLGISIPTSANYMSGLHDEIER